MSGRLSLAIEALRARVDEEFRITERLDGKGRQGFALAAGFFAITQAVAFGEFRELAVGGIDRVFMLGLAVLAAGALAYTAHRLANLEDLRPEKDIDPAYIEQWARSESDEGFARQMIVHLRQVAEARAASNEARVALYAQISTWTRTSLIFTGVELLLAITFRV